MFKKLHTLEKYFCLFFFGCLQFAFCFVLSFHRFVLFLAFLRPIYNILFSVIIHFVFVPSFFYFVFSIKLPFFIPFFKMATFDFLSFYDSFSLLSARYSQFMFRFRSEILGAFNLLLFEKKKLKS